MSEAVSPVYQYVFMAWCSVKAQGHLYLCHEEVLGSGGIAPCILNLGTRWRWVVSSTPRLLYPRRKSLRFPLDRSLGGPQSQFGRGGEKEIFRPSQESNPCRPAHSLVSVLSEISRLSYENKNKRLRRYKVVPVLQLSTTPWRCIVGVEVWLHTFFDLGTGWRWVISFTLRQLYLQRKGPWYPLDRRLGGP